MARSKRDAKTAAAILRMYAAGAGLAQLKQKFGIRGKGQLASAVLDALIAKGRLPALARGGAGKKVPKEFKVAVNKRGTIIIPKAAAVGAFRLKVGQSFRAKRWGK